MIRIKLLVQLYLNLNEVCNEMKKSRCFLKVCFLAPVVSLLSFMQEGITVDSPQVCEDSYLHWWKYINESREDASCWGQGRWLGQLFSVEAWGPPGKLCRRLITCTPSKGSGDILQVSLAQVTWEYGQIIPMVPKT